MKKELRNLEGQRFGRLVVKERLNKDKWGKWSWLCKCDCGNTLPIKQSSLLTGNSLSCGCLKKEIVSARRFKHGFANSKLEKVRLSMMERCYNLEHIGYANYGGRGISVCKEWKEDYSSFYKWAVDSGYHEDLSIDRIDVNGNYEPGNCRWATDIEQASNTRSNVFITYNGETKTQTQWSRDVGLLQPTLSYRLNHGWTIEEALTIPAEYTGKHKKRK